MSHNIIERYPDGTFKARDRLGKIVYGYRVEVRGKTYKRSGFHTRELARQARASRKVRPLYEEHGLLPSIKVRLSQLKTAWIEDARERELHPEYIRQGGFLMDELIKVCRADLTLDLLDISHIRTLRNRRAETLEPTSLRSNMGILRAILLSASVLFPDLRWTPPRINLPRADLSGRPVILSPDQVTALMEYLNAPTDNSRLKSSHALARDFVQIALHTLRRESEILTLTKSQVDFNAGPFGAITYILRKKKKGDGPKRKDKTVRLPMTREVREVIERRFAAARTNDLFGSDHLRAKAARLRRGFYAALDALNIPSGYPDGVVIHTIRHSAASYLMSGAAQLPLPVVVAILGHASETMTMKYLHPTDGDFDAAMQALSDFGAGKVQPLTSTIAAIKVKSDDQDAAHP